MFNNPLEAMSDTGQSPGLTRLDRILELVTQHDASYRRQELAIQELVKRVAYLEVENATYKRDAVGVDVRAELDSARGAMDRMHRQVARLSQQQQEDTEVLGTLVDDLRGQGEALEELRSSTTDAQLAEVEVEQLRRGQSRLSEELSSLQHGVEDAREASSHLAEGLEEVTGCLTELRALQKTGLEDVRSAAREEGQAAARFLEVQVAELQAGQDQLRHEQEDAAARAADESSDAADEDRRAGRELDRRVEALAEEQREVLRRVSRCQADVGELQRRCDEREKELQDMQELRKALSCMDVSVAVLQERQKQAQGLATAQEVQALAERLMRAEGSLAAAREELEPLPARVTQVEAELGDAKQAIGAAAEVAEEGHVLREELQDRTEDLSSLADCVSSVLRTHAACCSSVMDVTRAAAASAVHSNSSSNSIHQHHQLPSPFGLFPPPFASPAIDLSCWRSAYPIQGSGAVAVAAAVTEHQQQLLAGLDELQDIAARLRTRRERDRDGGLSYFSGGTGRDGNRNQHVNRRAARGRA